MTIRIPEFNKDLIEYPSDRVTLKTLRSLDISLDSSAGEKIEIMHSRELDFAELGFATGLGNAHLIEGMKLFITGWSETVDGPYDETAELQKARDALANDFVRFGVAEGLESAKQLLRRLEADAAKLGRELSAGRRP